MWSADVNLAGRQKDVDSDVDQQSALDFAEDFTGDNVIFGVFGDDFFPLADPIGFSFREDNQTEFVFDFFEQNGDF